jgi:hypothetical protein
MAGFVTIAPSLSDDRLIELLGIPPLGRPGRLLIEAVAEANRRGLDYGHEATHNFALRRTNLASFAR